ncbi:heme exporter protein CcmD [Luteithermobacter gelatinilyticus]|uniref:heme exporter protein CcmD n=1 Tax=Luteithermobacter gelatinilyticus TaxID=2582913 RepID=UPI001106D091|nr:heme exporter protein CcmD [Luteithermobacter gelatinilyticus]|tara:strand:- start:1470 stop:1676 length:207 start_codon:yes stop_codon:yes gene_type:complete
MEYGIFVWPSFGIVVGVMAALALGSWIGRRRDEAELEKLERALPRESSGQQSGQQEKLHSEQQESSVS